MLCFRRNANECVVADVDCGAPAKIANGKVNDFGATSYLAKTSVTCDDGYVLKGTNWRTCQGDGTWSDANTVSMCNPRNCGQSTPPAHAVTTCADGHTFGKKCITECKQGYELVQPSSNEAAKFVKAGKVERECGADGYWTGFQAECKIKVCDRGSVDSVENGVETCPAGHVYGKKCTFNCNQGFHLVGSPGTTKSKRSCLKTGLWDNSVSLKCEVDDCGALKAPDSGSMTCSKTSFDGSCLFSCNTGYTRLGAETSTCLAGSKWSHSAPTCQIKALFDV
jgi:hypothetical protein